MKRTRLSVSTIVLATILSLLAGCEKAETPVPKMETAEPMAPQTEVKPDAAGDSQSERESTLQMARQEIDQLQAKVEELGIKAKDASATLKEKMTPQVKGFEQDLKDLETKFGALKDASASAWADMKASFTASLDNLKGSVEKSVEKPDQNSNATGSS